MKNDFDELDLILGSQDDFRGPVQFDDDELPDPAGEFRKSQIDELSKASAGVLPAWMAAPDLCEVLGITTDADTLVKYDEPVEHIEGDTLSKRDLSKASSSPSKIRLEKTVIDAETWLFGFDSNGEEVFARPFVEDAA